MNCLLSRSLLATALAMTPLMSNAGLLGQTIQASGIGLSPESATIDASVEFTGISGHISFDFSDDALTLGIVNAHSVSWGDFGNYTFSGFITSITGLAIETNHGFSGDILTGFSFTQDSMTLHMGVSHACCGDDTKLKFRISAVPEPSTYALLFAGLAATLVARRRVR